MHTSRTSRPSTSASVAVRNFNLHESNGPYLGVHGVATGEGGARGCSSVSASARTSMTKVDLIPGEERQLDGDLSRVDAQLASSEGSPFQQEKPQEEVIPQTAQTSLTFLLVSGKRKNMNFDPDTTVGRVKDLVWNTWPQDWQDEGERPPAPSYLRILYMGKILQDDETLSSLKIPSHVPAPGVAGPKTIVHLSVRLSPASGADHGDSGFKKKKSSSSNLDAGAGCCSSCIIC